MGELREVALAALAAGISIIPIDHKTKRPESSLLRNYRWESYQESVSLPRDIERWCEEGVAAFAGIGGAVSGNLLVLDFDVAEVFDIWLASISELSSGIVIQETHSGREQVWFRCHSRVGGNEKLAWAPADNAMGREIAIETRGEGGYAVMAPSLGPSGKHYKLLQGSWDKLPVLGDATVQSLLGAARRLCKAPYTLQERERASKAKPPRQRQSSDSGSVIEAYNRANSLCGALGAVGYTPAHGGRWNRPGGETAGVIISQDGTHSFHFSSNDPLCDGKKHDAFDVYCHFRHSSDVGSAVREAARDMGMSAAVKQVVTPHANAGPIQPQAEGDGGLKKLIDDTASGARRTIPFTHDKITRFSRALLPGTCTIIAGLPGTCKSWFILAEVFQWFVDGYRPAMKVLEEAKSWHLYRMLALLEGNELITDDKWVRENPDAVKASYAKHESVLKEFGACVEDATGDHSYADLLRWAEARAADGHQIIVIDPVTLADGSTGIIHSDDKAFVRGLGALQNKYGVRNILVSHPRGGKQSDDPLDNLAGGKAYSRFTQNVLILQSHRSKPRPARVQNAYGTEDTIWVERSIGIAKARNGKGEGVSLAMKFDNKTLRFKEMGVIRAELKPKDMEGIQMPEAA